MRCEFTAPEWWCILPAGHRGDHISTWLSVEQPPDEDYLERLRQAREDAT